jgi:hypothetical protein
MGELCYRVSEDGDLPALLRLWEEAGWGTLTAERWREWFAGGPQGPCLITVAVDRRGEVVAQEVFAPARLLAAGREVRALRFSAPIVSPELRGASLQRHEHPLVGLYKAAAAAAHERGFEIVYSLPEHAWLRVLRLAPRVGVPRFGAAVFDCVELPLAASRSLERAARQVEAMPVARFGAEYEELWRAARQSFPIWCGVVRDGAWLTFRNSGRVSLEVRDRDDGSLVGYSATKRQTGLLADVLARRPEELPAVISATALWLARRQETEHGGIAALKAMRTPALAPALEVLGFTPVDYRFGFACNTLGPEDAGERIAPESWYVMPGD